MLRRRISANGTVAAGFVLLVALLLAGCVREDYRAESAAPNFPPFKGEVKLLERFPPAGTYRRLGVLTVESFGLSYLDSTTKKMKRSAAARGANAVVLQGKERVVTDSSGSERTILAGWAIRVLD